MIGAAGALAVLSRLAYADGKGRKLFFHIGAAAIGTGMLLLALQPLKELSDN